MAVYKHHSDDSARAYWSTEAPENREVEEFKVSAAYKKLKKELREAVIANLAEAQGSITPTVEFIGELTSFIDEQNKRSRKTLDARKDALLTLLQGKQTGEFIDEARKASGLAPAELRKLLVDKQNKPLAGVEKATITHLDGLIEKGKADAKHRREVAEAKQAMKSGK